MAQPLGTYDESLLRDAPVATKQQLQEGYTTDLLAKPRSLNRAQSPLPDGTAAIPLRGDLEQGRSQDGFTHYAPLGEKPILSSRTPFFRTTKGIIIIAVLAIIIVGVVVGAAVGTTVHKSQPVTNLASTTQSAASGLATSGPSSGNDGNGAGSGSGNGVGTGVLGSSSDAASSTLPFPPFSKPTGNANENAILQSESGAIAAMQHRRWDVSQASGNVDIS